MTGRKQQIKPYPLGAHSETDGIRFSFVSRKENCGIILYDRHSGRRLSKIAFSPKEKMGDIYCKYVEDVDPSAVTYQFYEEDRVVPDARARIFVKRNPYGKECSVKDLKAGFLQEDFDWEGDTRPRIPYEDCVCYCMHIRGFTRHPSSGVEHRGTFLGVKEKIPYLKETGITTVELQPAYEFLEMPDDEERKKQFPHGVVSEADLDRLCPKRLNYWGYKKGYYYAPKAAYAAGEDASLEFKEMVKAFHANGMEVVMQFYFPSEVERSEIAEILHFWVLTYHVDGFHLMGEHIPATLIARDSALTDTKLWHDSFRIDDIYERDEAPAYRNLAEYREDYFYTMRRYLKSDEDMLNSVLYQMRCNPAKAGRIHYMTNYYGMTLMDLVSYDHKHNEANGENNRDGISSNCSWNCGEEGASRRKSVRVARRKQIKNAIMMLLLSQSTPLIFMGDEFGNSQKGNNNAYCQDNAVTWLDWKDLEHNKDIYDFWQRLVKLRREHRILHSAKEFALMDSIPCGYPDLSYHGQTAWRAQTESYNRHIGIMYCGKYAKDARGQEDAFFYLAMNMYWGSQTLALPRLPRGMKWEQVMCTEETDIHTSAMEGLKGSRVKEGQPGTAKIEESAAKEAEGDTAPEDTVRKIPARTISLFMSVPVQAKKAPNKKAKRKG